LPPYCPGKGCLEPDLMIVGEAPSFKEVEEQEPFRGPAGGLLDEALEAAGIRRSSVYLTNVSKYQPPLNDFKKLSMVGVDIQEQIENLWEQEIKVFKPKCILAVGDHALNALTSYSGILNYRGSILSGNRINSNTGQSFKVVPTVHFAALFKRPGETDGLPYVYKKLIFADVARAVEESRSALIELPERTITIAHSYLELYRFYQEYKSLRKAANDIESINCIPVSSSFAFTRHHAVVCPLLDHIGPHRLTDMSRRELIDCWQLMQQMYNEIAIIGQNYKYDDYKLGLAGFNIPNVVSDTLLKTRLLFRELPIKSLGVQTSLWTREPYYKDDGKENKIGKAFDVKKFFIYNGKDSCVTIEIDEEQEIDLRELGDRLNLPLVEFYYKYIMKKHKFYLKMENSGFRIDFEKKLFLKTSYTEMWRVEQHKLEEMVGHEINVKSYPQVGELLYKEFNFTIPKRLGPTSEDAIIAHMANHCKGAKAKYLPVLEQVLTVRRIRDQLSRAINFVPDYDNRYKTDYAIEATETARSTTHVLEKPIRPKKIGLAGHTIPKHGKLAKDIRSMFIADEGKVIIQADSGQAEARIVAVLARDWDLLRAFDEVDIHRRTAGLFFQYTPTLVLAKIEVPIVDWLEKDGPERFTGKMFRHAGNYDMGKARAMNEFNVNAQKYGIPMTISEWRAGQYIDLFHAASPKIRSVFHQEVALALRDSRILVNPFGRPRVFNGRMDHDLDKEGYAYIPQSTVADLVQSAALAIDDELNGDTEVFFCGENHDALVMQAPINNWEPYARLMKKHMQKEIDFGSYCTLKRDFKLVIPADIEVGLDFKTGLPTDYAHLNKVKMEVMV
jgi:uracil-DNA glycosylase family 4